MQPYTEKKTRWLDWFLWDKASFSGHGPEKSVGASGSNAGGRNSSPELPETNSKASINSKASTNGKATTISKAATAAQSENGKEAPAKPENVEVSHVPSASAV